MFSIRNSPACLNIVRNCPLEISSMRIDIFVEDELLHVGCASYTLNHDRNLVPS
jgi:hypothetical protein